MWGASLFQIVEGDVGSGSRNYDEINGSNDSEVKLGMNDFWKYECVLEVVIRWVGGGGGKGYDL